MGRAPAPGAALAGGALAAAPLRLLSDRRLASLAAAGNRAAFGAIYERHHQAVYRYCRTITRDDEDARDALQATMLKAIDGIGTRPEKPRAWLYRIAHNESVSLLRRRERQDADPLSGAERAPDAPLEARERLRELLDDIGRLSERQRQVLLMRELGDLAYDEIATALGCSPAAAKQAAFDARNALHELNEGRDADCALVRRRISDGDRRLLRARGVRAHLRACDPCRRFEVALRSRRTKLAGLVRGLSPAASAGLLDSALGGGAATIGGAAAAGGAALGGGTLAKGVLAGLAALVAAGGAIVVESNRAGSGLGGQGADPALERATGSPAAVLGAPADERASAASGRSRESETGRGSAEDAGASGGGSAGAGPDEAAGAGGSAGEDPIEGVSRPLATAPPRTPPATRPQPPERPAPSDSRPTRPGIRPPDGTAPARPVAPTPTQPEIAPPTERPPRPSP